MAVQCGVLFSYQIIHLIPPKTDSFCETSREEFNIYIATFLRHVGVWVECLIRISNLRRVLRFQQQMKYEYILRSSLIELSFFVPIFSFLTFWLGRLGSSKLFGMLLTFILTNFLRQKLKQTRTKLFWLSLTTNTNFKN